MSNQEYLDIFDDNMQHIGVVSREEAHQRGYWHRTFHCWVIRQEAEKQFVLFQKRGPEKEAYPQLFDITAAGHLQAGERPEDGLRELNEELGIDCTMNDVRFLGLRRESFKAEKITNREFCAVYFLESNIPLEAYVLQEDEVSGLIQMELAAGMALFADEVQEVSVTGFERDEKGVNRHVDLAVRKEDFVPRLQGYYLTVFIMAERYFRGEKYLSL